MKSFFSDRGVGLAEVVLILLVVSLAQASISYTLSFGVLGKMLPSVMSPFVMPRLSSAETKTTLPWLGSVIESEQYLGRVLCRHLGGGGWRQRLEGKC